MVQDIFISLWKRRKELIITTSIENYLVKSAKLKVIDYYRSQYRKQKSITEVCNLCEHAEFSENTLQHNEAIDNFLEKDMQIIVNELPCQCQRIYRLSREEQLSLDEIAERLAISKKTVKNHLTKALSHIRTEISKGFLN